MALRFCFALAGWLFGVYRSLIKFVLLFISHAIMCTHSKSVKSPGGRQRPPSCIPILSRLPLKPTAARRFCRNVVNFLRSFLLSGRTDFSKLLSSPCEIPIALETFACVRSSILRAMRKFRLEATTIGIFPPCLSCSAASVTVLRFGKFFLPGYVPMSSSLPYTEYQISMDLSRYIIASHSITQPSPQP